MSNVITTTIIPPLSGLNINLLFVRYSKIQRWDVRSLKAPFWRYYLPINPGGSIIFNSKCFDLSAGKVFLISPHTDCSSHGSTEFSKFYCHFELHLRGLQFEAGVYSFDCNSDFFQHLINRLNAFSTSETQNAFCLKIMALESIFHCLQQFPLDNLTRTKDHSPCIQNAINAINRNLSSQLTNDELAAPSGLHRNSFIRLFTSEVGEAPQKYQQKLRLEMAARMLTETDETIESISSKCGFWDRNHFTRLFTRQWLLPPATYRKVNHK